MCLLLLSKEQKQFAKKFLTLLLYISQVQVQYPHNEHKIYESFKRLKGKMRGI